MNFKKNLSFNMNEKEHEFILVTGYNTNRTIMIRIKDIEYCIDQEYYTTIHTYDKCIYQVKDSSKQIFEMINKFLK